MQDECSLSKCLDSSHAFFVYGRLKFSLAARLRPRYVLQFCKEPSTAHSLLLDEGCFVMTPIFLSPDRHLDVDVSSETRFPPGFKDIGESCCAEVTPLPTGSVNRGALFRWKRGLSPAAKSRRHDPGRAGFE